MDTLSKFVWQDTEPRGFLKSAVVGHFAMWATRQSPYLFPDKLEAGIKEFSNSLIFGDGVWMGNDYYTEMTCSRLEMIVCKALVKCATIMSWNVPKKGDLQEFVFVSRLECPDPDYDIIDMHALARNIAHGVWIEMCYNDGILRMSP